VPPVSPGHRTDAPDQECEQDVTVACEQPQQHEEAEANLRARVEELRIPAGACT
jgi:hypothetical protein